MDVFISYARADGREFADRLSADLESRGNRPWLDRAEIEGGTTWSREVEAAIDRCHFLLALLSPASFESEICRGEQLRALRREKRVIPLLTRADADRPVYLEAKHYIDFSDASVYARRLQELLRAMSAGGGCALADLDVSLRQQVLANDASLLRVSSGAQSTWEDVKRRAAKQSERFLRELRGTEKIAGTYIAECYVPREGATRELTAFLEGDLPALVLVGDSGVGKSTLLCHWSVGLLEAGEAVFFYACGGSLSPKVEDELARDLGFDNAARLEDGLRHVESLAKQAGRRVVLVFDGINDFYVHDGPAVAELLRRLNEIVGRLDGTRIKVVMSCSTAAWARLRRDLKLSLFATRYHVTEQGERALTLRPFDDAEVAAAYPLYRRFFGLRSEWATLLPQLRARFHEPWIMRLMAQVYAGGARPIEAPNLTFDVLERYITSQTDAASLAFLDRLAANMIEGRRATLSVRELTERPEFAPHMDADDEDSIYSKLLDAGILSQSEGNLFRPATVRFTQPRVGAFLVARQAAQAGEPDERAFEELVAQSAAFPLAWDAALLLLPAVAGDTVFESLAASPRADLRELAAQGLRELHSIDPQRADALLARLVATTSEAAHRTALKAAYNIGPAMRSLFMSAALNDSESLRRALRDVLYLIWRTASCTDRDDTASALYVLWRHDPEFTYGLLREVVNRIGLRDFVRGGRLTRLFVELTVTIYINHCERPDVIAVTDELYHVLATQRLPFGKVLLKDRGPLVRGFVGWFAASFARPIFEWMNIDDAFFALPEADRQRLAAIADGLEPGTPLAGYAALIADLLKSDGVIFRGAAILVAATHAYRDFDSAEPVLRRLVGETDARGRLWLLLGFAVLLPDTPPSWRPFVDDLTARVLGELPADDDVYSELVLLPSGLAAGKRSDTMPFLEVRLRDSLARGDIDAASRLVRYLGPVAFYFPKTACRVLAGALGPKDGARLGDALVYCFARMRALYLDAADEYMEQLGIDDTLKRRIAAEASAQLVQRYVQVVGYYNNAVHFSVKYPRMRRVLSAGALKLLATAPSAETFIVEYGFRAVRMLKEANYRLIEWTKPDDAG
jgi:hypothetical protein